MAWTFDYNGKNPTSVRANANGQVSFGGTSFCMMTDGPNPIPFDKNWFGLTATVHNMSTECHIYTTWHFNCGVFSAYYWCANQLNRFYGQVSNGQSEHKYPSNYTGLCVRFQMQRDVCMYLEGHMKTQYSSDQNLGIATGSWFDTVWSPWTSVNPTTGHFTISTPSDTSIWSASCDKWNIYGWIGTGSAVDGCSWLNTIGGYARINLITAEFSRNGCVVSSGISNNRITVNSN